MAELQLNTAHRNALADATADIFDGGTLAVYTGSRPGAGETATGTLLCEIDLPTPAFGDASSGSAAKTNTWSGSVVASGAPGYGRLVNAAGTQIREFDAAETPGSGETMIFSNLDSGILVSGGTLTVDSYNLSQPAGDSV